MSEEGDDSAEKEFEATEARLEEQRRKGEVPRSTDLNTAAAMLGFVAAAGLQGPQAMDQIGRLGAVLLGQADRLAVLMTDRVTAPLGGVLWQMTIAVASFFVLPIVFVLASLLAQRALILAPEKVEPKLSRLSLLSNAKQKFGRDGLFQFAKSCVKLVIVTAILWVFVLDRLPRIMGSLTLSPALGTVEMLDMLLHFLVLICVVWAAIGAIDYLWARAEHLRRNRMSHKEMRDEHKQAEGDPHAKQERRRRGREIATNRMLDDVPDANVIIVNPTHYAVALKWSPLSPGAPVCVAKGVDEIAARIRERGRDAGVPIHSDPVTARALYATVKLGAEVRPEHYAAVAVAIRFAETVRARSQKGRVV
jgi:flagellar biosynthesis protein FlhB